MRENIEALGLGGVTRVFRRDATRLGAAPAGEGFSLAFLDPPYGKGLVPRALIALQAKGWIAPGALIIAETGRDEEAVMLPGFEVVSMREHGAARLSALRAAAHCEDAAS